MSNRAEGCGQWLSTNTKRTTTQLTRFQSGKAKKKKKKRVENFASRSGGLNVQVSFSPLSPRTVRKLQNAKQSKLDRFFKAEGPSNSDGRAKDNKADSKRKGSLEAQEKRVKIPVKRQREDSSSGCSAEMLQTNEHPIYSQEKDVCSTTDLNISGISHLSDSIDSSDELSENNLFQVSVSGKNRDSPDSCTLTPPTKKLKSGSNFSGSRVTERVDPVHSPENELSQSFHFSQWKKDQIAKCKGIQDGDFTECSPCADMGSLISAKEESGLELNHNSLGEGFSETPPFQFTQWAKQQVEACHKIHKEADSPETTPGQSLNSGEQTNELKCGSKCSVTLHSHSQPDSEFDFSDWTRNQIKLCKSLQQTEDSTSIDWESDKWDEWIYTAGKTARSSQSHSAESEFRFTQWVKSQVQKCRNIEENSEQRS